MIKERKKRKQVYFITTRLKKGGAEKAINILANNLSDYYDITVFVLNPDKKELSQKTKNMNLIFLKTIRIFRSFSILSPIKLIWLLSKLKNGDLLFSHQYYTFSSLVSGAASFIWRIPFVLKPIAPIPTDYPPTTPLLKMFGYILNRTVFRFVFYNAIFITPTSTFEKSYLLELGVNPNKIKIVPSGIDDPFFTYKSSQNIRSKIRSHYSLPHNAYLLLYVGRLEEMKGLHLFINALQKTLNVVPQTYALIVGDGSVLYKNKLRNQIKKYGIDKYVKFTGYLLGKTLLDHYAASDVFVHPSYMETAPLAVREAIAMGLSVVATNVGGTSEYVRNNIDGILVQPGNPSKLANAIVNVLLNQDSFNVNAENIRKYSWNHYVTQMRYIFEETLEGI